RLVVFLRRDRLLRLAGLFRQAVDARDDLLDRVVRGDERRDHVLLGHFLRARFDHHDAVVRAGDDEVERAAAALGERRVDDELSIDLADADAGNRLLEGDGGQRQRRGGAGDGEHVGVVLAVSREDEGDDLRLVTPAGGEEGADRTIDQPAREHFLFARLPLALEEPARDPARGVGVLLVVDGQRKEVDAFARTRRRAGG